MSHGDPHSGEMSHPPGDLDGPVPRHGEKKAKESAKDPDPR
jgi:hypothetical protein